MKKSSQMLISLQACLPRHSSDYGFYVLFTKGTFSTKAVNEN